MATVAHNEKICFSALCRPGEFRRDHIGLVEFELCGNSFRLGRFGGLPKNAICLFQPLLGWPIIWVFLIEFSG